MSRREPADPDAVLPVEAAERLLARASQLDAERSRAVPVAHLRAAAAEAGISPPAFEAALEELHAARAAPAPIAGTPRSRWRLGVRVAAGLLAGGMLAILGGRALTSADGPAPIEEALLLRCLPPAEAMELVRPLLSDPASRVVAAGAAPRVLTIRTSPAQMARAKALLARYENADVCPAPSTPAP